MRLSYVVIYISLPLFFTHADSLQLSFFLSLSLFFFLFVAMSYGIKDVSSLSWAQTRGPYTGSTES